MKANKTEQRALVNLLNRIYREIREIELEWDIRADESDYRPRIEYFHDAVRALTASGGKGSDLKGRLSVEMLAYDIDMLRYIQADPIPKARPHKLSALTDVAENALPRVRNDKTGIKPDAGVKYRLTDQYKNYSVIFAALLSEPAERNYMSRINECNAELDDLAAFIKSVVATAEGRHTADIDIEALADARIQTADAMNKIVAALHGGKLKKRMNAAEAERRLKEMLQIAGKEAKTIEKAHFTYATGQLAIYESARDVIKKMALKGFNIVGDFVQNAVRDALRGDRGR